MFTVKNSAEFISDVRALDDNLKNLRLSNIVVERSEKSIRYEFICDKAVSEELRNRILQEVEKITLPAFRKVSVSVKKIACDSELISNAVYKFLNSKYPSISIFLKTTDISCSVGEGEVRYTLKLTKEGCSRSVWELPDFFKDIPISYNKKAWKEDGFHSAAKGQEFVFEANEDVLNWLQKIFQNTQL